MPIKDKFALAVFVAAISFVSCNNRKAQINSITQERDSLIAMLSERDSMALEMNNYIEVIASSLDSIKEAEGIYTLTRTPEGVMLQKDEIKNNLDLLENVLHRQRGRIEDLEAMLRESRDSTNTLIVLIKHLYAQIDEKDAQIKKFASELDDMNKQISTLRNRERTIRKDLNEAYKTIDQQNEIIDEQKGVLDGTNDMLNTGFFLAASKKELQSMGILSRGLLSQKLVYSNIDPSQFDVIDMRELHEITFEKPFKVLSSMPEDSYVIERNVDSYILKITDPGKFWSISQYLIVQLQ